MANINIYGKLYNNTTEGIIAGAEQLWDETQQKMQDVINAELYEKSGDIDDVTQQITEITDRVDSIEGDITNIENNYATKDELTEAVGDIDLSGYATKTELDEVEAKIPTKVSELTNDSGYQTAAQVSASISALVDSAPETLDTLNELAAALNDDPNFATTITNQLGTKISTINASGTSPLTLTANKNGTTVTLNGSIATGKAISIAQMLNATTADLDDYNKLSDVGYYYATGGNTIANKPEGVVNFALAVLRSGNGVVSQLLVDGPKNDIWVRYWNNVDNNPSWSDWKCVSKPSLATTTEDGLMSAEDKAQFDKFVDSFTTMSSVSHMKDNNVFSQSDGNVNFNYGCVDVLAGNTSITNHSEVIPVATTSNAGVMSATDKAKLDGIDTSNLVTLNTSQTITGYKNFTNVIQFSTIRLAGSADPIGDSSIITTGQNVSDVARKVLNVNMANNDLFGIYAGGPNDDGFVMITTGDNGNEPIYIAQIDGNSATGDEEVTKEPIISHLITLMDAEGNSKFNTVDAYALDLNLKWDGNNGTQAANNYVNLRWSDTSNNAIGTVGYYNDHETNDNSRIIINANCRNIVDGSFGAYDTREGNYALEVGIGSLRYNAHDVLLDNSLKTINGQSLIGTGNITIEGGSDIDLSGYQTIAGLPDTITALRTDGSITYSASNVSIPTTKYTNNNGTWQSTTSSIGIRTATQSTAGTMSAADKTKLDSLESPTVSAAEGNLILWTGTQDEYDAIQTKSNTTIYFITEA